MLKENTYDLVLFAADLNINFLKVNNDFMSSSAMHLNELLGFYGLKQIVNEITYPSSKSILDFSLMVKSL